MCNAPYPAPRHRSDLRSYIWFCLYHIRHYNSSWNYYDGIEGAAMEEEIRRATTWGAAKLKFLAQARQRRRPLLSLLMINSDFLIKKQRYRIRQ